MDWLASVAWSGLIAFVVYQWVQSQQAQQARPRSQAMLLTPAASPPSKAAVAQTGKKGKNKKQNGVAGPKGMGGGLTGQQEASSSTGHEQVAAGQQVSGARWDDGHLEPNGIAARHAGGCL